MLFVCFFRASWKNYPSGEIGCEKTSKSGWHVRCNEQEELTKQEKNLLRLISLAVFISEGEVEDEI